MDYITYWPLNKDQIRRMSLKVNFKFKSSHVQDGGSGKQYGKVFSCSNCKYRTKKRHQYDRHTKICRRNGPAYSVGDKRRSEQSSSVDNHLNYKSRRRKSDVYNLKSQTTNGELGNCTEKPVLANCTEKTVLENCIEKRKDGRRPYVRKYACRGRKCSFLTTKPLEFLLHERNQHGKLFSIYACDQPGCSYASKFWNKVEQHRASNHQMAKAKNRVPYEVLGEGDASETDAAADQVTTVALDTAETDQVVAQDTGHGELDDECSERKRRKLDNEDQEGTLTQPDIDFSMDEVRVLIDNEPVRYQCKKCDFIVSESDQIKVHLLEHSKETVPSLESTSSSNLAENTKPTKSQSSRAKKFFFCDACDYRGDFLANLQRHKRNHRLENPRYRCNLCSYGGSRFFSIVKHLESHHFKHKIDVGQDVICTNSEGEKPGISVDVANDSIDESAGASVKIVPESIPEPLQSCDTESSRKSPPLQLDTANSDPCASEPVASETSEVSGQNTETRDCAEDASLNSATSSSFVIDSAEEASLNSASSSLPVADCAEDTILNSASSSSPVTNVPSSTEDTFKVPLAIEVNNSSNVLNPLPLPKKRPVHRSRVKKRRRIRNPVPEEYRSYRIRENGMMVCRFCTYTTSNMYKMRAHFSHHARRVDLNCSECGFTCGRVRDLINHQKDVHGDVSIIDKEIRDDVPLPESDQAASTSSTNSEQKEPPAKNYSEKFTDDQLCCKECEYIGKFPSDLQKHRLSAHDNDKKFVCQVCHRRYRWQQDLTNHQRLAHEGRIAAPKKGGSMRNFRRSSRKKRFSSMKKRQMRSVDQPITRLFCRLCDHVANCRTDLIRHAEVHTKSVAYKCETCGYETQWKSDLKRHLEKNHPMVYTSEFIITLYIEKIEDDVIDAVIDQEKSVEAFYDVGPSSDHNEFIDPNDIDIDTFDALMMSLKETRNIAKTSGVNSRVEKETGGQEPFTEGNTPAKVDVDKDEGDDKMIVDSFEKLENEPDKSLEMSNSSTESGGNSAGINQSNDASSSLSAAAAALSTESRSILNDNPWFKTEISIIASTRVLTSLCKLCPFKTTDPEDIVRHACAHENLKRFMCTICGKRLNHGSEIISHLEKAHCKNVGSSTSKYVETLSVTDARMTLNSYLINRRESRGGLNISSWAKLPTVPVLPDWIKHGNFNCQHCSFTTNSQWVFVNHLKISHPHGTDSSSVVFVPQNGLIPGVIDKSNVSSSKFTDADVPTSENLSRSNNCGNLKRIRRFKCSLCFFRGNTKEETEGHIEKLHSNTLIGQVEILSEEDALASYKEYEQAYGGKIGTNEKSENDLPLRNNELQTALLHEQMKKLNQPVVRQQSATDKFESWIWKCPKCNYQNHRRDLADLHINCYHSKTRRRIQIQCSLCSQSFVKLNLALDHIHSIHGIKSGITQYLYFPSVDDEREKDLEPILMCAFEKIPESKQDQGASRVENSIAPTETGVHHKNVIVENSVVSPGSSDKLAVPALGFHKNQNFPKGTRIYRCSICSFVTPFLNIIENHIAVNHSDKLKVLKSRLDMSPSPARGAEQGSTSTCQNDDSHMEETTSVSERRPDQMLSILQNLPKIAPKVPSSSEGNRSGGLLLSPSMAKVSSNVVVSQLSSTSFNSTVSRAKSRNPEQTPMTIPRMKPLTSSVHTSPTQARVSNDGVMNEPSSANANTKSAPVISFDGLTFVNTTAGKIYVCPLCSYRSSKSFNLQNHLGFHIPHPSRRMKCTMCPFWVKAQVFLERHMHLHKLPGNVLHNGANNSPRIYAATKEMALMRKSFFCSDCPYFCNELDLIRAHESGHQVAAKMRCKHCAFSQPTHPQISSHEYVHTAAYKLDRLRRLKEMALRNPFRVTESDSPKVQSPEMNQMSSHKTAGQKMVVPTKQDTQDPVAIATLKNEIISSRIVPSVVSRLPSDEDLVQIPIPGRNIKNVDAILHMNKNALNRRRCLYMCRYCPFTHLLPRELVRHEKLHGIELTENGVSLEKLLKCKYCDYHSTKDIYLARHEKVHSVQTRPNYYPHVETIYGYNDAKDYDDDDKEDTADFQIEIPLRESSASSTKGNTPEVESCRESSSADSSSYVPFRVQFDINRGVHIVRSTPPQKLTCERCPYGTTTQVQFQRHIALHGSKQEFTCDFCDYSVPMKPMLDLHAKLHLKPNRNLLQVQTVSNLATLPTIPADWAVALQSKTGSSADEDAISEELGIHSHLNLFENTDAKIRPRDLKEKPTLSCTMCPFSTTGQVWFNMHLKCHSARSPWVCPYCDFTCTMQKTLNSHIRFHFFTPNEDGTRPKSKDIFVRSHSVDEDYLHGGDDHEVNEKVMENTAAGSVDNVKSVTIENEPKTDAPQKVELMTTVEKSLAEFAASACLQSSFNLSQQTSSSEHPSEDTDETKPTNPDEQVPDESHSEAQNAEKTPEKMDTDSPSGSKYLVPSLKELASRINVDQSVDSENSVSTSKNNEISDGEALNSFDDNDLGSKDIQNAVSSAYANTGDIALNEIDSNSVGTNVEKPLMDVQNNELHSLGSSNECFVKRVVSEVPIALQIENEQTRNASSTSCSDDSGLVCQFCDREFTSIHQLQQHRKRHLVGNDYDEKSTLALSIAYN